MRIFFAGHLDETGNGLSFTTFRVHACPALAGILLQMLLLEIFQILIVSVMLLVMPEN